VACAVIVLATACGGGAEAPTADVDDRVPVRTASVVRGASAPPVRASGLVAGKEEARLGFKMGGVVAEVLVDEGARVEKGQRLATLKQDEASSRSVQARRGVEKAARDLERARTLHTQGVGTLQRLQDAQTALDVARADLTMAEFDQQHAVIVAPGDGIVLARMAEPNEMVQPGQPIVQIKSAGQGFVVRVGLADRDVVRVALGDPAQVRASAWPERTLAGRITQIAAAASPATGTFDVEIAVDPGDAMLLSGMHARVEIEPSRRDPVAWVPIDALLEGDGLHGSVYTVDPARGVARRVAVELAFLQGDRAALRGGLDGVDEVVTDGAAWLRDGAHVRVLPADVAINP
jgi:RND family efflux transporter MFP subunit